MNEILAILYQVKDSKEDLDKIHTFLNENILTEEETDLPIPDKFKKAVAEIADNMESGFICRIDKNTAAIVSVRRENPFDEHFFGEEEDEDEEEIIFDPDDIITINPLDSNEAFQIMEDFAESLDDSPLKIKLLSALNRNKPFAGFNSVIHTSVQKNEWFQFRKRAYEQHIAAILTAGSVW